MRGVKPAPASFAVQKQNCEHVVFIFGLRFGGSATKHVEPERFISNIRREKCHADGVVENLGKHLGAEGKSLCRGVFADLRSKPQSLCRPSARIMKHPTGVGKACRPLPTFADIGKLIYETPPQSLERHDMRTARLHDQSSCNVHVHCAVWKRNMRS